VEASDGETRPTGGQAPSNEPTWSALLAAYQQGPKEEWSGLLLERLGPWLTNARRALVTAPPYLDDEDVAQQLMAEVLRVAARWRPSCDDCWIPRKLAEYAERRVRESLNRERARRPLELDHELEAPQGAEPELTLAGPIRRASAEDLRLIYRVKVLGEPVTELARDAGITPRQMRQRVASARNRAQEAISTDEDNS
jgi:DNA-directed RNA polymerase specialized sigma24 family protein